MSTVLLVLVHAFEVVLGPAEFATRLTKTSHSNSCRAELDELEQNQNKTKKDLDEIEKDMDKIKTDVNVIEKDVNKIEKDMNEIRKDVNKIKKVVDEMLKTRGISINQEDSPWVVGKA